MKFPKKYNLRTINKSVGQYCISRVTNNTKMCSDLTTYVGNSVLSG